ncbi:MAG: 1,6-anhydro-N-acetylmuramyl-L-alanine amidase AmpD [Gammaproteobacteria bacterium]|nr:1,6-anhydro-N-acetylmuramyl-L-alanine amidase AmpD [Gammaproteobacteria bacterium]
MPGLSIDTTSGWIEGVRRMPSPNHDARPPGVLPELIVIHGISLPPGQFGGPWIDRLFTNSLPPDAHPYFAQVAGRQVSAHVLVRRDGSLTQYVPFHLRAWHAGASSFGGRSACNDFSVGIELEGADEVAYEDAQYASAASLIGALCAAYPTLSARQIVGHSDIAPGRKTDPGIAFDWPRLRALVEARA